MMCSCTVSVTDCRSREAKPNVGLGTDDVSSLQRKLAEDGGCSGEVAARSEIHRRRSTAGGGYKTVKAEKKKGV